MDTWLIIVLIVVALLVGAIIGFFLSQRYFKKYLNTTAIIYHRKLRLEYAKKLIIDGNDILDVPFQTGFESVSGFRSAFQQELNLCFASQILLL